jgi:hypothetical protein
MIVIGTIVGALIALITLENSNLYLRLTLLFSFGVMVFATMKVNVILTQIFLAPFRGAETFQTRYTKVSIQKRELAD